VRPFCKRRGGRTGRLCVRPFLNRIVALAIIVSAAGLPAAGKKQQLPRGYELLQQIRSPDQLVIPHLPAEYTVPVELSGAIADDMKKTLQGIGLEEPRYREVLDKKHHFRLFLANPGYSLETRELLSGVLNPVDMIDIIVSSVLKYRDAEQFHSIVNETVISQETARSADRVSYRLVLEPKGKYFAYSYEDMGAYIRETWLSKIICVMDSGTSLVQELTLHRHSRTYAADQTQKPPVDSAVLSYSFGYDTVDGMAVPAGLRLRVNAVQSLAIHASYRKQGKYLLFDSRQVCYVSPAHAARDTSCLIMRYGTYEFNSVPQDAGASVKPERYAQQMEKAAVLTKKAMDLLRSGNIESSIKTLKKVVADFPHTPQAVEARKLLSGLPQGE
jgi:hypothetical protein